VWRIAREACVASAGHCGYSRVVSIVASKKSDLPRLRCAVAAFESWFCVALAIWPCAVYNSHQPLTAEWSVVVLLILSKLEESVG